MPVELRDLAFVLMGWLLTPLSLALFWAAGRVWRRRGTGRRMLRVAVVVLLALLAAVALTLGAIGLWVRYRPHPASHERALHPGIAYRVFARTEPRPFVVHVATVDLDAPGLSFVLTPPSATAGCVPARTTSAFAQEFDAKLAINTQFFYRCPPGSGHLEPKELRSGQLLRPVGIYTVGRESVVDTPWNGSTMYFGEDGTVSLGEPPAVIVHAISGRHRLVQHGQAQTADDGLLAPRVALGLDASGRVLRVVLVDGRQLGYSEGVTLPEMASVLVELGVHDAIELDGGGSATMVTRGEDGQLEVLNSPIHTRIPGRERPVANHLGIRVSSERSADQEPS